MLTILCTSLLMNSLVFQAFCRCCLFIVATCKNCGKVFLPRVYVFGMQILVFSSALLAF